jgi:RNA polymerase sigma factor (sigma-70 family)
MADAATERLFPHLRRLLGARNPEAPPDGQLVERFHRHGDEAAFAELVRRHGPMVLGVCRSRLHNLHDAEDAFQATFLVLARKAGTIRRRDALAGWLYRVASHVSAQAAPRGPFRPRHVPELERADRAAGDPLLDLTVRELRQALYEELERLPEKYRLPLVLCYLEGRTQDEAARELGWSNAALRGRLIRGREQLRARLTRRGLGLSVGVATLGLASAAAVPPTLLGETVKAGMPFRMGTGAGAASAKAVALAEAVLHTLFLGRLKAGGACLLLAGVLATATGVLAQQALQGPPGPGGEPAQQADSPNRTDGPGTRVDAFGDPLPDGALARMGTVQLRHERLATATFSPDGKMIATVGSNSLRLWDARTGKLIREIKEHIVSGAMLYSPDGRWLTTHTTLLDPDTGRLLRQIPEASSLLAVSPDARLLAGTARDGAAVLWDTATGAEVRRLQGHEKQVRHEDQVSSAAFSPDGRTLVTFCWGKKLCRWEVATGVLQKTLTLALPQWRTLRLSPDARSLAVVPYSREAVEVWDTETGQQRCKLQGAPACARYGLAFTPDSRTLATNWAEDAADEVTISLWDAATGKSLRRFSLPARQVDFLHFAPDGHTLLTEGFGPLVRLSDTRTGQPALQPPPAHESEVTSLAFTPDGRTLVSGSRDATVRLWETDSGKQRAVLTGHRWGVNAVAALPDGRTVLSSGTDGTLRLWDSRAGKELRRLVIDEAPEGRTELGYQVLRLGLAGDGSAAASFSHRGGLVGADGPRSLLHVWDLGAAKAVSRRSADTPNQNQEVQGFSPDLKAYVSHVDTATQSEKKTTEKTVPPSGTVQVLLKEVATGRTLLTLPHPDRYSYVQPAFSPDGRLLVTITFRVGLANNQYYWDRHTLHFWELATGKERLTIQCPDNGEQYRLRTPTFAPDGRTLATSRNDHTIQLWDVASGKELLRRTGYDAEVYCLAFSPDGKALASGHADSTILLWDLTPVNATRNDPSVPAEGKVLEACWADLASDDAGKAHAAVWKLIAVPRQAVPLFGKQLSPAASPPAARLRQLLEQLDSAEFERREAASGELADLGERAHSALKAALQGDPSAEKRKRLEALLDAPAQVRSAEILRGVRAIEVLEQIGTTEGQRILEALAKGTPEARLTQEAKASLERLSRRHSLTP